MARTGATAITPPPRETYRMPPGRVVATFLPLTNTTAAPGLEVDDPDRWA